MSAIWGFAYLDGRPAPPEVIGNMADVARTWGPDGFATHTLGSSAFGQARLDTLPEDRFTSMPVVDSGRRHLFVATGRLDNREDLCDELGVPSLERPRTPDTALIAAAYDRWGDTCPSRLLGDWSLAAWHDRERKLAIRRQPAPAGTRLEQATRADAVAQSSSATSLATSSFPNAFCIKYALMNPSRSPSSTRVTSPTWCRVRRSFTI